MDKSERLMKVKEFVISKSKGNYSERKTLNGILNEGWEYIKNGMLKEGYTEDEVNIFHKELIQIQLEAKEALDKKLNGGK